MGIILHKNISDGERHNPKGFEGANFGDYFWKNEEGELEYIDELVLPSALNFVDASVAPPTTNTGDIYVLSSGGSVDAGWGTASLGDWVRYNGTEYKAITPQKSTLCYNENDDKLYSYDGANWNVVGRNISDANLTFDANHYADLGSFSWTLGGTAPIGTEKISLQRNTLVKGSDTSASTSGFKFVDSTNASLWDFRNNGDLYISKASVIDIGISNGITVNGFPDGGKSITFNGRYVFKQNFPNTSATVAQFETNSGAIAGRFVNDGGFISGGTLPIGTEKISLQNDTLVGKTGSKVGFMGTAPIVKITTGVSAGAFVANTSGIADDTATFGGYTIGQIAQALINYGLLT